MKINSNTPHIPFKAKISLEIYGQNEMAQAMQNIREGAAQQ